MSDRPDISQTLMLSAADAVRADLIDRFDRELKAVFYGTQTRFDAMDKANMVLAENVNRVPTLLDRTVVNLQTEAQKSEELLLSKMDDLRSLFEEKLVGMTVKFDAIQLQFRERDMRTDQDKVAASTAVNAALQAQKEAAGAQQENNATALAKSEAGVTKELDGIKQLINSKVDGLSADISNLTGRLDRGEGGNSGARQSRDDSRANTGMIVGVGGFAVAALMLMAMIYFNVASPHDSRQSQIDLSSRIDALAARINSIPLRPPQ